MQSLQVHFRRMVLGLVLSIGAVTTASAEPYAASPIIRIDHAQLLIVSDSEPPGTSVPGWRPVSLPDIWPMARYREGDNGWYRSMIMLAAPPAVTWGVYVPRLTMNAAVYLNGQLLGDGGSFAEPLGRNWTRPLYFRVPAGIWRAGANQLDIRLRSNPGAGLLGSVMAGPQALLMPRYERVYFFQAQLSAGLFVASLGIAIFIFSLWLKRRNDRQYLWFAVSAFAWAVLSINSFINSIPVSSFIWDWLMFSSIGWWTTALAMFVHRHVGYRHAATERALIAYPVIGMVLYAVSGKYLVVVSGIWMFGSIIIGGYAVWRLLQCRRALMASGGSQVKGLGITPREVGLLALGIAVVLLIGVQDWLVQNNFIGAGREFGHHLIIYSAPLLIMFVAWHLNQRFITALTEAEQLNQDLERRVAANRLELEKSYLQTYALEQERAVTEVRERIYRDLHDDVGAKLLSLVYRADSLAGADLARSALQDLRDVVSRTRTGTLTLEEALADWHAECAQRLESAGLDLTWTQAEELPSHALSPLQITNLGRILREAVSNVIHHAKAHHVEVRIALIEEQLVIEIGDDGNGQEGEGWRPGRGLHSMELRVKELGGHIRWLPRDPKGCLVCWEMPLIA